MKTTPTGPDWRPLLAITNSRSFGALRGLAKRSPARRETMVEGLVRFGFDAQGVFRVEVAVKP
jgi:hypothetical protein